MIKIRRRNIVSIPKWILTKQEYQQAFAKGFKLGWGKRTNTDVDDIYKIKFTDKCRAYKGRAYKGKLNIKDLEGYRNVNKETN